jgi:hypothetical protein
MRLVGLNRPLPRFDILVVTNPDILRHLANQPEVVTHKNEASIEVVDRITESVDTLI